MHEQSAMQTHNPPHHHKFPPEMSQSWELRFQTKLQQSVFSLFAKMAVQAGTIAATKLRRKKPKALYFSVSCSCLLMGK